MKFRIHMFEEIRRTYEVEADDIAHAARLADGPEFDFDDFIESERTGNYSDTFLIDPLLPDGEVDYENVRWFGENV